ncbi:hypothetical protein R1CP_40455 (plasmid) [Rhodococcus opacus]|uniref:CSD domain-containing protein n=1 Tax=Rhodococcus opacus TaxID=37919 RepID=A0A1B1KJ90_RHOOP|nr:cold-shock protein [Rhodococcus opacus]ANS32671.1 hypothetical protein R1CP_40455 [Rhodococcus opacus]
MAQGIVKWVNGQKGFGFIAPDDESPDLFFHFSQVVGDAKSLDKQQRVEFDVGESSQGAQATNIRLV